MDYTRLTDLEINALVARSLKLNVLQQTKYAIDGSILIVNRKTANMHQVVNYCNCAKDAYPIISSNQIGIFPPHFFTDTISGWGASAEYSSGEMYRSDNPLRAAMITFIKKQL